MTELTEEEARQKFCPFRSPAYRGAHRVGRGPGLNSSEIVDGTDRCITSDCMAWCASERFGEVLRSEPALPGSARPDWANGGRSDPQDKAKSLWICAKTEAVGHCVLLGEA